VTKNRWDIFCNIVDNFGDIGVCWRLSQQLANEHQLNMRLFIDDFYIASKIIPGFNPQMSVQTLQNVEITAWPIEQTTLPDVVIENFSCQLPEIYTQQIAKLDKNHKNSITWINLEYLSAEKWVEDCHALPSIHPTLGIRKTYFYPGFTEKTGGLLRERDLMMKRDTFLIDQHLQSIFWQKYVNADLAHTFEAAIKISLFSYPQADIKNLMLSLAKSEKSIHIFLPFNSEITALNDMIDEYQLIFGKVKRLNHLTLHLLPFLSQSEYDQLLWACDLNFVRGEDSWIRAIWAGKPFIWQPYIQEENTHLKKLAAFLDIYTKDMHKEIALIIQNTHRVWSNELPLPAENFWHEALNQLNSWQDFTKTKSNSLAEQASLTQQLLAFCKKVDNEKFI